MESLYKGVCVSLSPLSPPLYIIISINSIGIDGTFFVVDEIKV